MTIDEIKDAFEKLNNILERIRLQYHDGVAEISVNDEDIEAIKMGIIALWLCPIKKFKRDNSYQEIAEALHRVADMIKEME